jgi:hypothetical protein
VKLAGRYSLVATCEANGVNLLAYIEDVLTRVGTHPAAQIDDLLPQRWIGRATAASARSTTDRRTVSNRPICDVGYAPALT